MLRLRTVAMLVALAIAAPAFGATLTLPSVTVTSAPSTAITCSPSGAALVAPVPAGTVLFACTVAPAGWTGAVSISSGPQFVVTGLSGAAFSVSVGTTPLVAGTYAPGTLTTTP